MQWKEFLHSLLRNVFPFQGIQRGVRGVLGNAVPNVEAGNRLSHVLATVICHA